jgi:two-component system sensor histidine kinase KdpD
LAGLTARAWPITLSAVKLPRDLPLVEIDSLLNRTGIREPARKCGEVHAQRNRRSKSLAETEQKELLVTVSDQGHGIPAGEEKRIFEKFHRVDSEG